MLLSLVDGRLRFFFDDGADCILPHVTPHVVRQSTSFPRELPSAGTAVYLPLRKPVPDLLQEIVPALLIRDDFACEVPGGRPS